MGDITDPILELLVAEAGAWVTMVRSILYYCLAVEKVPPEIREKLQVYRPNLGEFAATGEQFKYLRLNPALLNRVLQCRVQSEVLELLTRRGELAEVRAVDLQLLPNLWRDFLDGEAVVEDASDHRHPRAGLRHEQLQNRICDIAHAPLPPDAAIRPRRRRSRRLRGPAAHEIVLSSSWRPAGLQGLEHGVTMRERIRQVLRPERLDLPRPLLELQERQLPARLFRSTEEVGTNDPNLEPQG